MHPRCQFELTHDQITSQTDVRCRGGDGGLRGPLSLVNATCRNGRGPHHLASQPTVTDRLRFVCLAAWPKRVSGHGADLSHRTRAWRQVWICTSTKHETSSKRHGVPVLRGITATTPAEAKAAAAALGTPVVVVKAQVKTGGRGKAGGVKIAKSPEEAEARADEILGLDIKGHIVKTVMIAEGADIAEEYYFSLLLDRAERRYLAMCSKEGGMDIETLAAERPDALARIPVDPRVGIDEAKADEIVAAAGFTGPDAAEIARVIQVLGTVYQKEDATLVEVNPLVKIGDGRIVALDAKVSLDENAAFRHPDHAALADVSAEDPLEAAAKAKGLNYVKLDGSVGDHRQWCWARDEHPRRRRVRRCRSFRDHRNRRISSTSVGAPAPRSWPTAWRSSSATNR